LCTARPDVTERRPGWPPEESEVVRLEPLSDDEVERLIAGLLGTSGMENRIKSKVVQAADGNPLFVEQLVSMLIDEGLLVRDDGHWVGHGDLSTVRVPTTISALLETRLDQLSAIERSTLERAAVVGKVFWPSSVAALLPEELRQSVGMSLLALERKEFVRPDPSSFLGEPALAFRHALIRDAAYQAMLKRTRSELHERFADWLEATAGQRLSEYEEILGHHLEQAFRHRAALGPVDEEGRALAGRAARWLIPAARRASARGDVAAQLNLFGRVEELLDREDPRHREVRLELALAVSAAGDIERAEALLGEITDEAHARRERPLELRSRIHRQWLRSLTHPTETPLARLLAEGEEAVTTFTEFGDDGGVALAWYLISTAHYLWSHHGPRLQAAQQALEHAMRAGDIQLASRCVRHIAFAMLHGSTPAKRAVQQSEDLLARFPGRPQFELVITTPMCVSLAMLGRFQPARQAAARAKAIAEDLGSKWNIALVLWMAGDVERLAAEWEAAERLYRAGYELYARMGERALLSTLAIFLGDAVYAQGRHDEAFELTQVSREAASPEDVTSQMFWRALRAKVLATRGATSEAERLGRDAVELGRQADCIDMQGDVLMDLSEVLRLAGRPHTAREAAEEALSLHKRKGNVVSAGRARAVLADLRGY